MEDQFSESFKGHFLMAMPGLNDPNFSQTVTCICEHSPAGAVGLIVNRIHSHLLTRNIFEELKVEFSPGAETIPIQMGGPVHIEELFVLHGPPFEWQGCLMVTEALALSNTRDILEAIALQKGPASFIITLGCAGWGPGQLETEVKANAWLTTPAVEPIIFDVPHEMKWAEAIKKMGIDPVFLSNTAGHA